MSEIKGWHVFAMFAFGFSIIIAVNLTLAWNAVRTFPGLEVGNSYVASQKFQANRAAQTALDWDVRAALDGAQLVLSISQDGRPLRPEIQSAVFGRATHVADDQMPELRFDGQVFRAPVRAGAGNWNLRLKARAPDGTVFQQRVVVEVIR